MIKLYKCNIFLIVDINSFLILYKTLKNFFNNKNIKLKNNYIIVSFVAFLQITYINKYNIEIECNIPLYVQINKIILYKTF